MHTSLPECIPPFALGPWIWDHTDASVISWRPGLTYTCPPSILNFLKRLIIKDESAVTIPIAPAWPKQFLDPQLIRLSIQPPITLPLSPDICPWTMGTFCIWTQPLYSSQPGCQLFNNHGETAKIFSYKVERTLQGSVLQGSGKGSSYGWGQFCNSIEHS